MEKSTLEKLILKVQDGDEEAFGLLYDEFAERIYKFIAFKVSSTEQAEDILQEVFVKAWHGCKKLPLHNLNFTAWLYTVASNTVRDYFRKMYRRPQTVSLDPALDVVAPEDSSKELSSSLDGALIQTSLAKLSSEYRQVLELRYIQELSVLETARIMHKSSVAIRVLQHRAIKKLQTIFKDHETR